MIFDYLAMDCKEFTQSYTVIFAGDKPCKSVVKKNINTGTTYHQYKDICLF